MLHHTAKQIYTATLEAKNILLIPHKQPDGDALGAVTAFAAWLETMQKQYAMFCATSVSDQWQYLSHIEKVSEDPELWKQPDLDLIIVFDSGDLRYAGVDQYIKKMATPPMIINIDHHKTNEQYGELNLVPKNASSTSEILYDFFSLHKIPITPQIATSMLTGIIYDTDNFTNSATTPHAIHVSSKLVNLGGNFNNIKEKMYKDMPFDAFPLWGTIFSRLKKHEPLNLVHTYLTHKDLEKHGLEDAAMSGLSNFMNNIHEGHAGMVLKETPEKTTKGSFRTTRNDVDVSAMAKHFGGGGHKKAAGFHIEKPLEEATEFIIKELELLFPKGLLITEIAQ
jgi:bifunctional oligoribonuclease and PAP phosphatase NrnA